MSHVLFIHGLSNKPDKDVLLEIWKRKLAHGDGIDLGTVGVSSELVYWADALYPEPDTNLAAYESAAAAPDVAAVARQHEVVEAAPAELPPKVQQLMVRLEVDTLDDDPGEVAVVSQAELAAIALERVPMPEWLRKRVMRKLARDAYLYFYNKSFSPRPKVSYRIRDELRGRLVSRLQALRATSDRLVVVSHSMGTIIAYDCLACVPDCPAIDGFMTIGSPLGLDEVQDFWTGWTRDSGFPTAKLRGDWVNVFDPLDVVAGMDPRLGNDYQDSRAQRVRDISESNWGTWRHSISKYLQGPRLRAALGQMLELDRP